MILTRVAYLTGAIKTTKHKTEKTMIKRMLTLTILAALAWQVSAQKEPVIDEVVAVVGKNIVKLSDIENAYASIRVRQGYDKPFENRCSILESILINKLLIHKGQVDSTKVTDEEIDNNVQYYIKNYERQYGSKEAIRQATGYNYDELKTLLGKMLRDRIMAERVQSQLTSDVKITPGEVNEFYRKIPADSLPTVPATYEIAEIVCKPEISDNERERVKVELNKMRERILGGDQFSMLATLYSEDPGSATKGGELGFFTRGDMVSEFEAAAFALKPGEVSPVIETQYGFHILQLIERRGNSINVRHILMTPKVSAEDLLRSRILLDSVAQEIKKGNMTFAEAAKQYSDNPNKMHGGTVTHPSNGGSKFTADELKQLYANINITNMNPGDISAASQMKTEENKDAYRIVTLIKKTPEHKANLADDYDHIFETALENAKQEKLLTWAQKTIKNTYINISKDYQDCTFRLDWTAK